VRQALVTATNRQQIIDDVFKGNALLPSSPLLFGMATTTDTTQSDVAKAAQLLDQAGWKVDSKTNLRANKKGQVLELTIATNDSLPNSKAAETLANQWKALNIKVNLTVLPTQQLTDSMIRPRTFDVLLFPQKFGADPDPFLFWHSSQVKDPGFNLTGFADPSADKLITEARTTTNAQTREDKYQQFSKLISTQIPVMFLDQTMYIYAVDKNVKNINLRTLYEPNQRFYDTPSWYIETARVWK
jgi:peptide/nickel transport system substrate-binding protein